MALTPSGNPAPSISSNPFTGILTTALHNTFTNAIDALLEDGACSTPCELIFSNCKKDCTNCTAQGFYSPNGPFPFGRGMICGNCMGKRVVEVPGQNQTVNLLITFNSRKWIVLARNTKALNSPDMFAETMCRIEWYNHLMIADYVRLDSDNRCFGDNKWQRVGHPERCGLGTMEYILTGWEKVA